MVLTNRNSVGISELVHFIHSNRMIMNYLQSACVSGIRNTTPLFGHLESVGLTISTQSDI